jgi:hypothetical protein
MWVTLRTCTPYFNALITDDGCTSLAQVICDPSIEFIHGGLDKQVTHHLFPRIPRHNLRAASLLVKEFCKEQDLEFAEWGFQEGSRQVMSVVSSVSPAPLEITG